jgi:hypothetical protein
MKGSGGWGRIRGTKMRKTERGRRRPNTGSPAHLSY